MDSTTNLGCPPPSQYAIVANEGLGWDPPDPKNVKKKSWWWRASILGGGDNLSARWMIFLFPPGLVGLLVMNIYIK